MDDEPIINGRYILQEEIGRGPVGILYRAFDRTLNHNVAIKAIHPHWDSLYERIAQKVHAWSQLKHDNIVTIHSIELHEPTPIFVMELLEHESLGRRLWRSHRMTPRYALSIGHQLSLALVCAHSRASYTATSTFPP